MATTPSDFVTEVTNMSNATAALEAPATSALDFVMVTFYGVICALGLFGNVLVMWAILNHNHMRSAANWFIFNLSVADSLFLLGLPLTITTTLIKEWAFGGVACRLYFIVTSINQVTGAFTLTMMSLDRFFAVCCPIFAHNFRTMRYANVAILIIWLTSLLFISPIILFANVTPNGRGGDSCGVSWPSHSAVLGNRIYVIYTFLLSFAVPVVLICAFYVLIVLRLQRQSRVSNTQNRKDQTAKVTKLVGLVISVFFVCWAPFWATQIYIIANLTSKSFTPSKIEMVRYLIQAFTILSYANSAMNPVIYAFTNNQFRNTFKKAFGMASVMSQPDGRSRAPEHMTLMAKGVKEENMAN